MRSGAFALTRLHWLAVNAVRGYVGPGYAEVKRRVSSNLLTCGEHEYTRYGFRRLLEKKCCDVLQPDITWCGGLTEARRIVACLPACLHSCACKRVSACALPSRFVWRVCSSAM